MTNYKVSVGNGIKFCTTHKELERDTRVVYDFP